MIAPLINTPLALWEDYAVRLLDGVAGTQARAFEPDARAPAARSYALLDGIAVIPVHGVLVHDGFSFFGETDYRGIGQSLAAALADDAARAIVLHVNSPGGEVAGCFDLADRIHAARGDKPIWSILDDIAYSAAYALASAADAIAVPRTGGTGSIGVIMLRLDITKSLEQFGVKVDTIKYGERKDDHQPTTPLTAAARGRMQDDIDAMGEMFVELVARNRGLAAAAVRGMQAGTFLGRAGVDQGLADAVMSPDEAFLALRDAIS